MIIEHARLSITPGQENDFLAAFAEGRKVIARQPGCRSVELRRCVEEPSVFLLVVGWERLEDHLELFRNSDDFPVWRGHVAGFFTAAPEVEHFRPA